MPFPLPLVPFEKYMLIDDRPTHPMSFFFRLVFSGTCEPRRLDDALRATLRRHPLLSATICDDAPPGFQWSRGTSEDAAVCWSPSDDSDQVTHIDLAHQPGLRVKGRQRTEGLEVLMQFHHACCDAIGALQFLEDWLTAYAAPPGDLGGENGYRLLNEELLIERARFGLRRSDMFSIARQQVVGLWGVGQFLTRRPVPLLPVSDESRNAALPPDFPASKVHHFSAAETKNLLASARAAGATLNDLLVRDLFLALGQFRADRRLARRAEWFRIPTPINLSTRPDRNLPATNVVGMVFLDRRPVDFSDPVELLTGLARQMSEIKAKRLGLIFPLSVRIACALPGAIPRMRRAAANPTCHGTAVLSNLGRTVFGAPLPTCDRKVLAGQMVLERIEFLPPVRPQTFAAFGAITYADRLHVALHFDSRSLSSADAQELLGRFVSKMLTSQQ